MARPKPTPTARSDRYFLWGKVLMGVALVITVVNLIALQQEIPPVTDNVLGNEVISIDYIVALVEGGKLVLTLLNMALLTFIAATGLFVLGLRELFAPRPPTPPRERG